MYPEINCQFLENFVVDFLKQNYSIQAFLSVTSNVILLFKLCHKIILFLESSVICIYRVIREPKYFFFFLVLRLHFTHWSSFRQDCVKKVATTKKAMFLELSLQIRKKKFWKSRQIKFLLILLLLIAFNVQLVKKKKNLIISKQIIVQK